MRVSPYLIFNGNAEEAANFYAEALGGKIENMARYGECPDCGMGPLPEEYNAKIAHICMMFGEVGFGMADAMPGMNTAFGTGNTITIHCDNADHAQSVYAALSQGGTVCCPLQQTFYAQLYGELTDRFGVQWALMFE